MPKWEDTCDEGQIRAGQGRWLYYNIGGIIVNKWKSVMKRILAFWRWYVQIDRWKDLSISGEEECLHHRHHWPRYQLSASDGEGASKYRIALLSTSRRTVGWNQQQSDRGSMWNLPLPWTMLAGCGSVCIRSTAHKSTLELGSLPSEGSRQSTNKSLHNMPISGRGVSSGAKQSTCTVDWSPWAFIASNDTVALRTTRVRSKGPSIIRRLWQVRTWYFRSGVEDVPMGLD